MKEDVIRERVRTMLETGQLPCDEPKETWAGPGEGQRCAACGTVIPQTELEFEVSLTPGTVLRLHRRCHVIWLEECEPSRA